jgi:F-type H+-transporting ATPase subunit a
MTPNPSTLRHRWRRLTASPLFAVVALVVAMGLIFGGQLLAEPGEENPDAHANPEGVLHASEDAEHGGAEHGDGHGEAHGGGHGGGGVEHPPNLFSALAALIEGKALHGPEEAENPVARFLMAFKGPLFSLLVVIILVSIAVAGTRTLTMIPGPAQNFVEWVVESLDGFVKGVIGPEGGRFVPFIGTLFLYIYGMNVIGLFPLGFGPTSMLETTLALALCVFLYVQWTGIRSNGVVGYVSHLAGDPKSPVEWAMVPLLLPLHIVGEIAKPISLSLRLFGNILGGETLLAVFTGLGVAMLAFTHLPVGIPLQTPFIFLELLVTLIQALVFTLLATIYFALVLPHDEHH